MLKCFRKRDDREELVIRVKRLFKDNPKVRLLRIDIHSDCTGVASFFIEGKAEPEQVILSGIGTIS